MSTLSIHSIAVNCGHPKPPVNGSLESYFQTTEGANVISYCNENFLPNVPILSVCTSDAIWDPNPDYINCTLNSKLPITIEAGY